MLDVSPLQKKRLEYQPVVPAILRDLKNVAFRASGKKGGEGLKKVFPRTFDQEMYRVERGRGKAWGALKVGVVFSGGQASGGHNVVAAIYDAVGDGEVIGFLGGPSGIVEGKSKRIGKEIEGYRNQGGFDLLGSGRTKIETAEQLEASRETCERLGLDGLVVVGGDDSNTNAAILAEYFLEKGCGTRVIGVPKTIDGDLRGEGIEISFGFDTACKTYSEIIGNIARDAISAKKYYHFIKLMGRSASHITLECARATRPNLALIGEERKGLETIVTEIADLICRRKEAGKEYGVILVPEGLIEFIPEGKLPEKIQKLLVDRDPHGNVQLSSIQTEQLLIDLVTEEMKSRGGKFSAQGHFLGYEGRACMPTNFDANYCYALGLLAALCVREGLTGMICAIQNLKRPAEEWELKAVPIVNLIHFEMRKGKEKPVIQKALVDIKQGPFVYFSRHRKAWEIEDHYRYPGPIQFFGDRELTDSIPITLMG